MNDKLIFRSFNDEDYITIFKWWKWWWKHHKGDPPPRALLPKDERCFIIEKNNIPVACYFLFIMEPMTVGWATYLASNPEYKEKDRRLIIEQLVISIEEEAKSQGIKFMFTVCESIHMQNIHNKLGWTISKAPTYETFKYI